MFINEDSYEIEIKVIEKFTKDSVKNGGYDFVYNPLDCNFCDDFMKYYDISIKSEKNIIRIALFGDYHIYDDNCAVFENEMLTVLVNDNIARIDIINGKLIYFKEFDIFGIAEEIYKTPFGYVIKGEIDIIGLDENFDEAWKFGSRDIFECADNKEPFVLCDDRIKLYNFLDDYFELDLNGNLMKEVISEKTLK